MNAQEPRAPRGSYPKGRARRQQIVETALEVFASSGFRGGSLREIAKRAGLTPAGLLHHFSGKEDLFAEVIRQRDERVRAAAGEIDDGHIVDQIRDVVAYNRSTRGLTSLYTVVAAEATDAEHPAHEEFRRRYADRARATTELLRRAQERGEIRADLDPAAAARLIAAVMDGLQQQWLLDDSVDMVAAIDEFLRGYLLPPG